MSTPANTDTPSVDRLTLVLRSVPELTPDLANAVYEAASGHCEIAMRDRLLYVELPSDLADVWERTPGLLAAIKGVVPEADLVRVEAADMMTAAERAHEPLQSPA